METKTDRKEFSDLVWEIMISSNYSKETLLLAKELYQNVINMPADNTVYLKGCIAQLKESMK